MWVLLVTLTIRPAQKASAKLFKAKVGSGEISLSLIQESVVGHQEALMEYFKPWVTMAESLARSSGSSLHRKVAAKMYSLAFTEFRGLFSQQEVTGLHDPRADGSGGRCWDC